MKDGSFAVIIAGVELPEVGNIKNETNLKNSNILWMIRNRSLNEKYHVIGYKDLTRYNNND